MRARDSTRCYTEATNRIDFRPGTVTDIATDVAPLLVDSAEAAAEGLYSMDADEYSMLMDAAHVQCSGSDEPTSNS